MHEDPKDVALYLLGMDLNIGDKLRSRSWFGNTVSSAQHTYTVKGYEYGVSLLFANHCISLIVLLPVPTIEYPEHVAEFVIDPFDVYSGYERLPRD